MLDVRRSMLNGLLSLCASRIYVYLIVGLILPGCCGNTKPPTTRPAWSGPTDSMDVVIADINRNSLRLPTISANLTFSASVVDAEKNVTNGSGDGGLLYARPYSLLLTGNNALVGKVFELGSNGSEYWVNLLSGKDAHSYWWGHYANLGKPGCKSVPIRPDLILHVLGVGLYQTNFLEEPVPVMRFDNAEDAYIFDMNIKATDHWETQEEIWYDRQTRQPTRVLLYGENGRIQLSANLSAPITVNTPGVAKERWPTVASHYELTFPDSGTQIRFDLYDPALQHSVRGHHAVPNAGSFVRKEPDSGTKVIQVDAAYNDAAVLAR